MGYNPTHGIAGNLWFNGDISEIIFTDDTLTTEDHQKVEGYLAWKYGLQSSLTPSHPYASTQPSSSIGAQNVQVWKDLSNNTVAFLSSSGTLYATSSHAISASYIPSTTDYSTWREAIINRNSSAITSQGTDVSVTQSGTGAGTGVSSLFDKELPKIYTTNGTTVEGNARIYSWLGHTFYPRGRFLVSAYYASSSITDNESLSWYAVTDITDTTISNNPNPLCNMLGWKCDDNVDSTWYAYASNGTSSVSASTGLVGREAEQLEIRWNLGCTSAEFYNNGQLITIISSSLPNTMSNVGMYMSSYGYTTTDRSLRAGYLKLQQDPKFS
jgi:uncharacterized protein (DUF2147 family)